MPPGTAAAAAAAESTDATTAQSTRFIYGLVCPDPCRIHFVEVSSGSAMGPRA